MPDMDGVEAASRIGKLGLPKMPRIIAVTADMSHQRPRATRGRRHRQDRQQADPDQRAARGDRGRRPDPAGRGATRRRRIDRPAFPRRPASCSARRRSKTPPSAGGDQRKAGRGHRQGSSDWRSHAAGALRASTRQRRGALGLVRLFEFCREIELAAVHDVPARMPERRPRTRRASEGLDECAGRSASAGLTAFGH